MDCENLAKCPIYNMLISSDIGIESPLIEEYCKGNYQKCARYILKNKLGKEFVPEWMMPNMKDEAVRIIEQHQAN